ncbi:hypothetical protein BCR42DRAFT_321453 [Absidia repens]|uniref:F-box domain-containing protein n=1 Tax=Absidia repens TaxID=90262 RepID=A0A1X2IRL1_9FUNG|nr:hypothetical protein BCR42DRAFT_321453 [Absidia repens]
MSTVDAPLVHDLPTEILDRIFSSADIWQLATLRQVCSHWRCIVDKPSRWKRVLLRERSQPRQKRISSPPSAFTSNLWTLDSLRYLLNPNLHHIQSLTISGVRDSTVRFILLQCPLLENLEIMSWNTLSNHALTLIHHLNLRCFKIIGIVDQFLAIDALSLAHFILFCPSLHKLSINHCRICVHPDIFLKQLRSRLGDSCLYTMTSIILSSLQQPWSRHHVDQLLALCPSLYHLRLESKSSTIIMTKQLDSQYITVTAMN